MSRLIRVHGALPFVIAAVLVICRLAGMAVGHG